MERVCVKRAKCEREAGGSEEIKNARAMGKIRGSKATAKASVKHKA